MSNSIVISHAFVLPERDFEQWLQVMGPYRKQFKRVSVLRGSAGHNLNRYRNVSAVEAPLTWQDDSALQHIRRIYPAVVLVDVVPASSPQQLASILQRRIKNRDRYGATDNDPQHIFLRFALAWMSSARPMRVLGAFNDDAEAGPLRPSMDIATQRGADVLCAAGGVVSAINAARTALQVSTQVEQQRYITSYEGLERLRVKRGQKLRIGQVIAQAAGERLSITVQNPPRGGKSLLGWDNLLNPRDSIFIPELRARPQRDGLRLRKMPGLDSPVIGRVYSWQLLEPLEQSGRAIEKFGKRGAWLRVRAASGGRGYCAAWYLQATTQQEGVVALPGINPVGVNLDVNHPLGRPAPASLGKLGWLRFGYNVSQARGSEDIDKALQRYLPLMEKYRKAGYRIIFVTSHQTYGEGKSQYWPWSQMTDSKWRGLRKRFTRMMQAIARQWAGRDIVGAWQIWNEPDSLAAVASVPMSAHNYGALFAEAQQAVRSEDSRVKIITAGFNSGPQSGSAYARRMLRVVPADAQPDGIAFHPYGRGVNGHPYYALFGHIDESVWAYSAVLPEKPLWMTEFGVLDRPKDSPTQIAHYATEMLRYLKTQYPGKFAALVWYAWAQGMHNGYGLVDRHGKARPPLTERFLEA